MQRLVLLVVTLALAWSSTSQALVVPSSFQHKPRPRRLLVPLARPSLPQSTLGAGLSVNEALEMLQGLDRPTVDDYNLALAACAKDGNHGEPACWLIEEIAEWGMEPDRTSYALAIEACAPAGLVEEARHLLECMKDADHSLDVEIYGNVAMACERAKNWRQLMWCVRRAKTRYCLLLTAYCLPCRVWARLLPIIHAMNY